MTYSRSVPAKVMGPAKRAAAFALVAGLVFAVWSWWRGSDQVVHRHLPGAHGGTIISVGHEHHHVEALMAEGGVLKLFMLGQDYSQVATVSEQKLTAYVRTRETTVATQVALKPTPQSGDPIGETSVFEGQLPLELAGGDLAIVVPSIVIGDKRYRLSFLTHDDHETGMPRKVTNETERKLYLTPGGKFTADDIKANGSTTASQKYRGFHSDHDMHPLEGERICPITHTKANAKCTWIIDGKKYAFCCPPCIDEFVKLAKEHPDQLKAPAEYVQK